MKSIEQRISILEKKTKINEGWSQVISLLKKSGFSKNEISTNLYYKDNYRVWVSRDGSIDLDIVDTDQEKISGTITKKLSYEELKDWILTLKRNEPNESVQIKDFLDKVTKLAKIRNWNPRIEIGSYNKCVINISCSKNENELYFSSEFNPVKELKNSYSIEKSARLFLQKLSQEISRNFNL